MGGGTTARMYLHFDDNCGNQNSDTLYQISQDVNERSPYVDVHLLLIVMAVSVTLLVTMPVAVTVAVLLSVAMVAAQPAVRVSVATLV